MSRIVNRIGWILMGYPSMIGFGRRQCGVPGWARVYGLGARLHNCQSRRFTEGDTGDAPRSQ